MNAARSPSLEADVPLAVDSDVVFWSPEVKVGEQGAFQMSLTAPKSNTISSIPFTQLTLHFSEDFSPITLEHEASDAESTVQKVDLGLITTNESEDTIKANLRWRPGQTIVFAGLMKSEVPTVLKVCLLSCRL